MYSFFYSKVKNKTITDDLYAHLIKALRFKVGDCFLFFDEQFEYNCQITKIEKDKAFYEILGTNNLVISNPPFITLIQGYPKKDKVDFICKYATMFNVKEIIFVYMKRSIPIYQYPTIKIQRLETIIQDAVTLSKRKTVPKVSIVTSIKEINYSLFDSVYLCYEEETNKMQIQRTNNIAIIIGPEGGFDLDEVNFLKKYAKIISLGPNILSTEAASLAVLSLFL